MITAKYIQDTTEKTKGEIFPNDSIIVNYKDIVLAKPTIDYISMDGNGIDLYNDTSEFVLKNYDYCGYISQDVSDFEGNIDDTISIYGYQEGDSITAENNLKIFNGITFGFVKDYVEEIQITALDKEDGVVLDDSFTITQLYQHIDLEPFYCNRIYIKFKKTHTPNSFVKLETLVLGNIHLFNDFLSFDAIDELNLLSSDLPIGQIEFSVNSDNDLIETEGNTVYFYDDSDFIGHYFVKKIEKENKKVYRFVTWNLIYKFDNVIYNDYAINENKWKYENVNAYDELVKLCDYVGVEYIIDENIRNIWLSSYMPSNKTARYVLQQICFACGACVKCWKKDFILITLDKGTNKKTISNNDDVILSTKIKNEKDISDVHWTVVNLVPKETDPIPKTIVTLPASPLYINTYYFNQPIAITEVNSAQHDVYYESSPEYISVESNYETAAYVVGYELKTTSIKKVININLLGKPLSLSNCNLFGFSSKDTHIESLPDITKKSIEEYYKNNRILTATIAHKGERVGDIITIQTVDDKFFTGIINRLHFSSPSTYRTAEIEVKEWNIQI